MKPGCRILVPEEFIKTLSPEVFPNKKQMVLASAARENKIDEK
jgi:hypothetical protein